MFAPDLVKPEWSVRTQATDDVYYKSSHAPRLDLAVGPFNVTNGSKRDDLACIGEHQRSPCGGLSRPARLRQYRRDAVMRGLEAARRLKKGQAPPFHGTDSRPAWALMPYAAIETPVGC